MLRNYSTLLRITCCVPAIRAAPMRYDVPVSRGSMLVHPAGARMSAHQAQPGQPTAAAAMMLLHDALKRVNVHPPQSFPRIITDTAENRRTGEHRCLLGTSCAATGMLTATGRLGAGKDPWPEGLEGEQLLRWWFSQHGGFVHEKLSLAEEVAAGSLCSRSRCVALPSCIICSACMHAAPFIMHAQSVDGDRAG